MKLGKTFKMRENKRKRDMKGYYSIEESRIMETQLNVKDENDEGKKVKERYERLYPLSRC